MPGETKLRPACTASMADKRSMPMARLRTTAFESANNTHLIASVLMVRLMQVVPQAATRDSHGSLRDERAVVT